MRRLARHAALAAAVAALAWAVAVPGQACAATIGVGEFASRIESASVAVGRVASDATSSTVGVQVADAVDVLLPVGLRVSEGTATIVVADDVTVRELTAALRDAVDVGERAGAARDLAAHLASMRSAVGTSSPDISDPAALAELLAGRPVSTGSSGNWLNDQIDKLLRAIGDWFRGLNLGGAGANPYSLGRIVTYLVIVIPVVLVVWVVARARRRRRGTLSPRRGAAEPASAAAPAVAASADLPADPLAYAGSLAAEGRTRDAVRALYGGAARHLVEAGVVQRMRTRTNHEMLRDVAAASPLLAPAFGDLTADFEAAWYGHAEPGAPGYERARASYESIVTGQGPAAERVPAAKQAPAAEQSPAAEPADAASPAPGAAPGTSAPPGAEGGPR